MKNRYYLWLGVSATAIATIAAAQETPHYSLYGTPGLIEMPSAFSAPDAEIGLSYNSFELQQRGTLTFQITPRLSGSFRYTHFDNYTGNGVDDTYDRSFDFQYRLLDESDWMPAVAVGLRDFAGTGLLTSEYVVASKHLTDDINVTGGVGWGRLGSYNGVSGFAERPENDFENGGVPAWDQYFRGDMAAFGGVEWQITPQFAMVAEYSSDAYTRETDNGSFEHNSPFNFGVTYTPTDRIAISAYSLYGTDVGLSFTTTLNPKYRATVGGADPAPLPVRVRPADSQNEVWARTPEVESALRTAVTQALAADGIVVDSMSFTDDQVRIRYTNNKYRAEVQGVGHVARTLTQAMPNGIDDFLIEPMRNGIPISATLIHRSDLEQFETSADGTAEIYRRSLTTAAGPRGDLVDAPQTEDRFTWGIVPYGEVILFDSQNPGSFEAGLQASFEYKIEPNLVLAGSIKKSVYDNRDQLGTIKPSTLQPVRRNAPIYAEEGDGGIERLSLSWYGHPSADLYSRVTLGYIEQMHGGVSTELLWHPLESRLALGAELNYTAQRDYDQGFGFQDYEVLSGHMSAYYEFDQGFHATVHAGRYLAGDWGATVALDREFDNGWKIGAYATLTDVPFDDFGEGSFDKGIRVTIPFDWITGQPSRLENNTTLSSLTRDGGARLDVQDRLYEVVRDGDITSYDASWGRFWR